MGSLLPDLGLEVLPGRVVPGRSTDFAPAVEEIGRRHGLTVLPPRRHDDGSKPVLATGPGHVIKLYPPDLRVSADRECTALTALAGRLFLPTPAVVAEGELEGWRYLVLERLAGENLRRVAPHLPDPTLWKIAEYLGIAVAQLHEMPAEWIEGSAEWESELVHLRESCVERQEANGLAREWLDAIPEFLDSVDLAAVSEVRHGPLHTEIMREHVLVGKDGSGWRAIGWVDFERAMIGPPEYDFAGVGIFFSEGDSRILRAFLQGYGLEPGHADREFRRRVMAYALLHRHSNLHWFLERAPLELATPCFDTLADFWWSA